MFLHNVHQSECDVKTNNLLQIQLLLCSSYASVQFLIDTIVQILCNNKLMILSVVNSNKHLVSFRQTSALQSCMNTLNTDLKLPVFLLLSTETQSSYEC